MYKFYEIQKYMTLTRHVYPPHIDVASLKWWKSLKPETRDMVAKAMYDAALFQRADNRAKDAHRLKLLRDKGMEIETAPDIQAFRQQVADMKNMELYQDARVHALLLKMLDATR